MVVGHCKDKTNTFGAHFDDRREKNKRFKENVATTHVAAAEKRQNEENTNDNFFQDSRPSRLRGGTTRYPVPPITDG